MRGIRLGKFDGVLAGRFLFFGLVVLAVTAAAASATSAQTVKVGGTVGGSDDPVYTAYRGVHIGSTASEARKALGDPADKSDAQDIFLINEKEIATVVYDKEHKVTAISIDFTGDESHPPTAIEVVGSTPPTKPDGSTSMMVRYPKAGYWVCYNRSGATPVTVSVTMQKMQ
jgi:hypothetical protein